LEIDSCYYLLVDDAAFFDNIGNLTKGIAYYWQWNISVVSLDINAIKKPQKQSIHCYPNPITNDLFVELDKEANYKISIINIKGQVVLTENIWGKSAHFSTQNLNTGFYFLSVIGDDTQTQVKLIRK
jgi:hypothetical protein